MENPYGATADALKDTRLTLRDIAAGILANKKMESDLKLGEAKANTETAMVQAGITRDQLNNDLHMTSLAEASRHNMADEGYNKSRIGIEQQNADTSTMIGKSTVNLHNAQAGAIARQAQADNEVLTAQQYAMRMGAPGMPEMLGIDPNTKQTAAQWAPMGQNILGLLKQSPAMQITYQGYKIKSQLEDISQQYNTPGLDAKTKSKLKKDMESKYDQLQRMDHFIMSVKEPDATKIAETARKLWTENPTLATQYENYDQFAGEFDANIKQTRGVFHNDLARLQTRLATMDIDPDYEQTMLSAITAIRAMPDKKLAGRIDAERQRLLQAGDLKGAYDYVTRWANSPQTKQPAAGTPAPISFEDAVASQKRVNAANTTATGLNWRDVPQKLGLTTDWNTRLKAIERDYKAGVMTEDQYNKLRNEISVNVAARRK